MTSMDPQQASHLHPNLMNRFPLVLYSVLQDALTDPELAEIISWELSGTAFRIHDQKSCVEKVFPRYFPRMKSYCSLRRQLNLYGILVQSYDPSRTFSLHVLSPADKKKKNHDALLLHRGVSSSGVYSHPFLRQDRLDLAAIIPRTGLPARRTRNCRVPALPLPPRERHHFGGSTFFTKQDTTTTSATTRNTTAATIPIAADAALHYVALSSEFPNSFTDRYYPDKYNFYKSYYDIRTSATPSTSTSTVVMASCPDTKNSTTSPPNVVLAPLDHAKPTARFFLSLMYGSGGELRLDGQQQEYFFHPSDSYRNSAAVIPTSSTVSIHADDHDDDVTTWINDDPNPPAISCSIRLKEQHHQNQQPFSLLLRHSSTTIQHDEDIRLEIIQTFL